jgi:uncharacterized protein
VGLSPKTHRDSYRVAAYMQAQGFRIVPINPLANEILGEKAYPSLQAAAQHVSIDLVNVFRQSEEVPPIMQDAVAIGAKAVWLQIGIEHEASAQWAQSQGLAVVQNRCLMVEHRRQAT